MILLLLVPTFAFLGFIAFIAVASDVQDGKANAKRQGIDTSKATLFGYAKK